MDLFYLGYVIAFSWWQRVRDQPSLNCVGSGQYNYARIIGMNIVFVYPITSIYTVNPHVITKVFEDLKQNAAETKKKKKKRPTPWRIIHVRWWQSKGNHESPEKIVKHMRRKHETCTPAVLRFARDGSHQRHKNKEWYHYNTRYL